MFQPLFQPFAISQPLFFILYHFAFRHSSSFPISQPLFLNLYYFPNWSSKTYNYHVDFRPETIVYGLLRFNKAVYTSDYQESGNPANILSVNRVRVIILYNF